MKFLLWDIKYVGLGTRPALSVFNRELIREAKKRQETGGGKPNKLAAVEYVKEKTKTSLADSVQFCREHIFPK